MKGEGGPRHWPAALRLDQNYFVQLGMPVGTLGFGAIYSLGGQLYKLLRGGGCGRSLLASRLTFEELLQKLPVGATSFGATAASLRPIRCRRP
jgi:hypothetical protein